MTNNKNGKTGFVFIHFITETCFLQCSVQINGVIINYPRSASMISVYLNSQDKTGFIPNYP